MDICRTGRIARGIGCVRLLLRRLPLPTRTAAPIQRGKEQDQASYNYRHNRQDGYRNDQSPVRRAVWRLCPSRRIANFPFLFYLSLGRRARIGGNRLAGVLAYLHTAICAELRTFFKFRAAMDAVTHKSTPSTALTTSLGVSTSALAPSNSPGLPKPYSQPMKGMPSFSATSKSWKRSPTII